MTKSNDNWKIGWQIAVQIEEASEHDVCYMLLKAAIKANKRRSG